MNGSVSDKAGKGWWVEWGVVIHGWVLYSLVCSTYRIDLFPLESVEQAAKHKAVVVVILLKASLRLCSSDSVIRTVFALLLITAWTELALFPGHRGLQKSGLVSAVTNHWITNHWPGRYAIKLESHFWVRLTSASLITCIMAEEPNEL